MHKTGIFGKLGLMFYKRKYFSLTLLLGLVILGGFFYKQKMPREGFPNVASPIVVINVTDFKEGASQQKLDTEAVSKIIEELNKDQNVKQFNASTSNPNISSIVIVYKDGINSQDKSNELLRTRTIKALTNDFGINAFPLAAGKLTDKGDDLLISISAEKSQSFGDLNKTAMQAMDFLDGKIKNVKALNHISNYNEEGTVQTAIDFTGYRANGVPYSTKSELIGLITQEKTDQINLKADTEKAIEELNRQNFMAGYRSVIAADFATDIERNVSVLESSLIEGMIIVIIVTLIIISWRIGIIVAISMVATLAVTIITLHIIGYSLNTITLFALILSLALIVDDTMIMAEGIDHGMQNGLGRSDAVRAALRKVARASFIGTLTTILGFAPLLFVSGILGKFIFAIPVTIIISLAASLLISFTFLPYLANILPKSYKKPLVLLGWFSTNASQRMSTMFLALKKRKTALRSMLVISFLVFAASLAGAGFFAQKLAFDIFPPSKDSNQFTVTATPIRQFNIAEVTKLAEDTNQIILDKTPGYFESFTYAGTGSDRGFFITVSLKDFEKRKDNISVVVRDVSLELNQKLGQSAGFVVDSVGVGPPAGEFALKIYGDSVKTRPVANEIKTYIESSELTLSKGDKIKLINPIVSLETQILRDAKGSYIRVSAGLNKQSVSEQSALAQDLVDKKFDQAYLTSQSISKEDFVYDFGQESDNQDSFKTMLLAFPILIVVMYIVLAIQFRSVLQPLLILLAVPYSLFGIMIGLYLTDNALSFFVMIGLFALIGVSINNTILLTDYANRSREEGKSPETAMSEAIRERLRPLITTSSTSIVALLPLALNDPFWESLAVTLIFGLLSSTLLVVMVFPFGYIFVEKMRTHSRKLIRRS